MSTKMQQQVACNDTQQSVTFLVTLSNKNIQLKELGRWIKSHREKMNLSQETAAEKAGLSRFQWIRIENGQSGTKRETLIQIAKVISANVDQTLIKGGFVDSKTVSQQDVHFQIPESLSKVDFSIFNEYELKEIEDFIKFKEQQKLDEIVSNNSSNTDIIFLDVVNTLSDSHPKSLKLHVMKNLLTNKNLTEETAIGLYNLFSKAYDAASDEMMDEKTKLEELKGTKAKESEKVF